MNIKARYLSWVAATSVLAPSAVHADTFFTMVYRGTNPDHQFSLQWGDCRTLGDDGSNHQLVAQVLDKQWNDSAQQTFTKTSRFSLADLSCRPATVTLRTTPRFEYTLQIP
jgi:hypothetical protein